jgi:hypothetical protein
VTNDSIPKKIEGVAEEVVAVEVVAAAAAVVIVAEPSMDCKPEGN